MISTCTDGTSDPLTTTAIDKQPKEQKTLQAAKVASSDNNTAKFTPGTRVEKSSPPPNENLMNPTVPNADDVDEPTAPASPDVLSKEPNVEEGLDLMVSKDLIFKKRAVGLHGVGGLLAKDEPDIGGDLRLSKRSTTIANESRLSIVIPGHMVIWGHGLRWHDGLALFIGYGTLTECNLDADIVVQGMSECRLGGGFSMKTSRSQCKELVPKPLQRHCHAIEIYTLELETTKILRSYLNRRNIVVAESWTDSSGGWMMGISSS